MSSRSHWIAVVLCSSALLPSAAVASSTEAPIPRVRTLDPAIRVFLETGRERSATFERLVGRIDLTDGLVYVHAGDCRHHVHACLLFSVTRAGPNRLLRIIIDTDRQPRDVIASIAHELTHALEVLEESAIGDDQAIFNFYNRQGLKRGEAFETPEAIDAEVKVRSELGRDVAKFLGQGRRGANQSQLRLLPDVAVTIESRASLLWPLR